MNSIICPICGVATTFGSVPINGHLGSAVTDYTKDKRYGTFICNSCDELFVAIDTKVGIWTPVHPIKHTHISEDVPEPIRSNFEEASLCFAVSAFRASVVMCQVSLEALWRDNKVSNLSELQNAGIISSAFRQRADEIRLWNNVIKHEAQMDTVSKDDCEQLLEYMEAVLDHVYIEPKRFERLKEKRKGLEKPKQ